MASLLSRLFGLHRNHRDARFDRPSAPILPTPDTRPVRTPPPSETPAPLKNWCHPFKDKRDPLAQLTHMANANAGYYPLGRSGLFHGGVHFDGGTAGLLDQSRVHCLADGEVVAYRVDTRAPTTYFVNTISVAKPFSRNFVLVRHRLQPPKIDGSPDTPPSLTFYSLYMHLQDWETYQEKNSVERPAFWPQSPTLRVKQTANDVRPGQLDQLGLNVRHSERHGKVIDLLPRGAEVTISGTGRYSKLENRPGPTKLINADGSLAGYISASILQPIAGNQYRINSSKELVSVHAEPKDPCPILLELPTGTVVTVSGEGEFRKLERVDQYVYFDLLEGAQEPLAVDRIIVLDQPVPIKAGDLIGHLGKYQDCRAEQPEHKLHLEVFSGDDVDLFLENSRAWAQRLPDKNKTWLKLAKGTPVVPHEDNVTAALLKVMSADSPVTAADLLVPKSLLDGLSAKDKIVVPATDVHKARNWYRLDGLLHDADNNLLNGWVCEEAGVTPWLSPWSWEGYDVIFDYGLPKHAMASFFSALNRFSDAQRERFQPWAEKDNNGPMKSRLYEIINRERVGKMTAEELQAALRLPAHAQAISQMILRKESEWFYQTQKWDALDELLGHSGSTPHLNWLAEKQRIEQMSWWGDVAEKVGLPSWGRPYHFHPIGLAGSFCAALDENDLVWLAVPYGQLTFDVEGNDIEDELNPLYRYFSRVAHWPGGASGVTIGRGYDLGQRPNPIKDLNAAGIEEPLLSWLSGAKGLKGGAAKNYISDAPADIRKKKITRKQQYELFLPVYEHMKKEVVRISNINTVRGSYGTLNWSAVDGKIQDVLIDLIYRGDYGTNARTFIQKPFVENNFSAIKEIISSKNYWATVPDDRFKRRAEYLK
ncbi:pesticin C-terminus-like muramidase [Pseudomonas baetica]|uniref:pesticin C-terminus-like muramidase n=1 Tax=Pseudomonas baetica TaxID=674054 RepID=UPI002406F4C1|nr:pesticin C-terminus-like muramidase [Pseudomonas baetica]MDF9777664.1 hypothetical protein [Pseudomonas baetica]